MLKYKNKIILVIWSLIILILTGFPLPEYNGTVETYYDKIVHVFLFGIFSFLVFVNLFKKYKKKKAVIISFLSGVAYSSFVEIMQNYVPGRDPNKLDLLAGVLGIILFLNIAVLKYKKT